MPTPEETAPFLPADSIPDQPTEQSTTEVDDEEISATGETCKMAMHGNCADQPTVGVCAICREPFCEKHRSEVDPDSCCICVDYKSAETERGPLVSDDGVQHNGAIIHPIGYSYRTLMRRIVEMDDNQLEMHIQHVRVQVKQAETVLDYRRIDLSASTVELEERGIAKQKKLRAKGIETLANGTHAVTMPSPGSTKTIEEKRAKATASVADQMKKVGAMLGLDMSKPENLVKLAQHMQKMKK